MNRLPRWLLRLYPEDFRLRFETEMAETLAALDHEASQLRRVATAALVARESLGIVSGAGREWLSRRAAAGPWLVALLLAAAVHAFAYAVLVPIGPGAAAATTGASLFRLGAILSCCAAVAAAFATIRPARLAASILLAGGVAVAQGTPVQEIARTYEATFAAIREIRTKADLARMVDAIDVPEWQGHLPDGSIVTRSEAIVSLTGLLGMPPENRPVPRQRILFATETGWSAVVVYWVYRQAGDQLIGSLARDTWARTPRGWRRIRHEKIFPDRPLTQGGQALILPALE